MICMFKALHFCQLMYLKNVRNMRLETQELDPAHFLTAPGLAWQAALKKTKVKLDLSTDIIRRVIYHSIYRYANANNRYMKGCDYIKNCHIFNIWM